MTATINETGQIVLPREASQAAKAHTGEEYRVLVSTSGRIMLLPRRRHLRSLVDHLQGLNGLEISHRRDPAPEPPKL